MYEVGFDNREYGDRCVGHVCTIPVPAATEEARARAQANAHLIAAAPDLLAFANAYMDMAANVTNKGTSARPTVAQLNALFDQARAAIKKAQGATAWPRKT